ncbi:MAG: ABC transporter permease [Clostridiales bacterium]|jgi:ABC-type antimicrobial peptide transport system permease subunit|nr:ABC transporter permease [Clostridiales bacterium]
MKISDLLRMGLRSLFRRKVRTILTVLGVVIGCLFIIITISIGHGMDKSFETQVKEYGSLTAITVSKYGMIYDENGNWAGSQDQKLDKDLLEKIKAIDHVRAVTPVLSGEGELWSGKYRSGIGIMAMDMASFDDFEFPELVYGEYPTEEDNSTMIFGHYLPWEFYDQYYRSFKQVDLEKDQLVFKFYNWQYKRNERKREFVLPVKNIAKMEETKSNFDYNIYMDIDYFEKIYLQYCNTLTLDDRKKAIKVLDEYQEIRLNVDNIDNVEEVQDKIKELGFQSESLLQFLKPTIEASKTLQLIFFFLGAVSMFVSAISIANTMVMSIYERTKEIGVMKVLGCVVKDIRLLFLFEAGMIGFLGGVTGVGLGYLASYLINKYGQPLFGALMTGGSPMGDVAGATYSIIPLYLPVLGLSISVVVGLLSGYFPARRATKISAIEAMRTEN